MQLLCRYSQLLQLALYVAVGFVGRVANGGLGVLLTIELSDLLASGGEGSGSGSLPYYILNDIKHIRDGLAALTVSYTV